MSSILLFNTSFQNRGDALMAEAVLQQLGPSHSWSVAADVAVGGGRESRAMKPNLVSMLPGATFKQHAFNSGIAVADAMWRLIPEIVRKRLPVTSFRDVDVAIDLSGYCFGDQWGQDRVERASLTYQLLREAGARIVLMPRTWGPFETISAASMDALFDQVDLAFARDQRSLSITQVKLSPANHRKLSFAPDYTHAVEPDPARWPVEPGTVMLIPSSRVIDSGTMSRNDYHELFADARAQLAACGLRPRLLIHEISNDLAFIGQAGAMGFTHEEVLKPENAIAAKSMIAQASAVVTSRLHGLYNALNSQVPVAVVAWSFKYEEALKQYDCTQCLVDMSRPQESLPEKIRLITDPGTAADLQERMRRGKAEQVRLTDAMWQRVSEVTGLELSDPQR